MYSNFKFLVVLYRHANSIILYTIVHTTKQTNSNGTQKDNKPYHIQCRIQHTLVQLNELVCDVECIQLSCKVIVTELYANYSISNSPDN